MRYLRAHDARSTCFGHAIPTPKVIRKQVHGVLIIAQVVQVNSKYGNHCLPTKETLTITTYYGGLVIALLIWEQIY